MTNRLLSFILIACFATTSLTAQVCGTYEGSYKEQKQKYPAFYQNLESVNADLAAKHKLALSKMTHHKTENGKKIIPVVVHVIHDGIPNTGDENLTISQIQNGLDHLNKNINGQDDDFLTGTPDIFASVRGDLNVEFRLAKKDPLGAPTSGVVRVVSELTDLPAPRDQVKALSYWNSYEYLNIWAVRSIPAIMSEVDPTVEYSPALNGYAQFPFNFYNTLSDWFNDGAPGMSTDGVVIRAAELAAGRTLTHEVGHWLGLRHTWGDATCASDKISDTPQDRQGNFDWDGTFPFQVDWCGIGSNAPAGEMYMNYMDYQADAVGTMFTKGQVVAMMETLDGIYDSETGETDIGFREYMWLPDNLEATGTNDGYYSTESCTQEPEFEIHSSSSAIFCEGEEVWLSTNSKSYDDIISVSWDMGDGTVTSGEYQSSLGYFYRHTYDDPDVYDISLTIEYTETTEARALSLSDLDLSNAISYDSIVTTVVQGEESELIAMGATNIVLHMDVDSMSTKSVWKLNIPEDSIVGAHSSFAIGPDVFQIVFSADPGDSLEIEEYERLAACDYTWQVDSIDNNTGEPLIFYYGEFGSIGFDAYFMDTLFYRGHLEQKTYIAKYTNTCELETEKKKFIVVDSPSTSIAIEEGNSKRYRFEDADDLSDDPSDLSADWHITPEVIDGDWNFESRENPSWQWIDGVAESGDASIIFHRDNLTPRIAYGNDELISAAYDLSNLSNPGIKFSWSGAAANTFFDNELIVSYSTNCGEDWSELGRLNSYTAQYGVRANGVLVPWGDTWTGVVDTITLIGAASAGLYTTSFKPAANEWNDTIMSHAALINHNVKFKFDYVSRYLHPNRPHGSANNFYIDNIEIGEASELFTPNVISASKIVIYPNPTNGQVVINLEDLAHTNVEVKLVNILGAEVKDLFEGEITSNYYTLDNIDLSALKTGIYFVKVIADGNIIRTDKLILNK